MSAPSSGPRRPGIVIYLAAFVVLFAARSTLSAPVHESDSTQVAEYDGGSSGCYYNYQHYEEGARIITNEPCLNCTCHNRMLMCYLRVCPFTKAIGQDCTAEKRPDQCCPVITCPEVPVQLLTSTTTSPFDKSLSSSTSSNGLISAGGDDASSTELGFPDTYGCNVNDRFYADGAQLPIDYNNPCELCYCIRNKTTCLMQQCTLTVAGCRPVYQPGICCPVKYNCDYEEEYEITAGTTPGLIITTTTEAAPYTSPPQCHHEDKIYEDGELIYTIQPCQHCYCLHGKIVCAVQECGKPMESHGKNCTALPPPDGECCPTTYQCEDGLGHIATEIPEVSDKKVISEQSTEKEPESFPGADNTIPEEVPHHGPATDESQTASPFGNEVPEVEPTKSTATEASPPQESYTTLLPEDEKSAEPAGRQPETESQDGSSELTAIDDSSEETLTEESEKKTVEESDTSSTTPSSIKDDHVSDIGKEDKATTISTVAAKESSEPSSEAQFTTVATRGNDLANEATTEKQISSSETSSTESAVERIDSTHQPIVITTEKESLEEPTTTLSEELEKSSELSSPISEITTEQSSSKDTSEETILTSSTESDKHVDSAQEDVTTEKVEDKQTESSVTPKETSTEEKRDEITISPESIATDMPSEDKSSETKTPSSIDSEKETASESSETTVPIGLEYSTEIPSEYDRSTPSTDKDTSSENINVISSSESSAGDDSIPKEIPVESSTNLNEVDETTVEEKSFTTVIPQISDELPEKPRDETSSQSSTESAHSEEPEIPQQGPTGIPIPERVPEHKAEDKDAVTEGYLTPDSGMPHKVDNLQTDLPEYVPTTYLPPLGSSTEADRHSSTPLYEDLPKEVVEGETTEISITPKTPVDKTAVDETSENAIPEEKKGPFETSTDIPEKTSDDELTAAITDSSEEHDEEGTGKSEAKEPEKEDQTETFEENLITTENPTIDNVTMKIIESTSEEAIDKSSSAEPTMDTTSKPDNEEAGVTIKPVSAESTERTNEIDSTEVKSDDKSVTEEPSTTSEKTAEKSNEEDAVSTQTTESSITDKPTSDNEKEQSTEKSADFDDKKSSTPVYTESPETSSPESVTQDQDLSREVSTTESETQKKPTDEGEMESDKSHSPSIIPTTPAPERHETESPVNELTSIVDESTEEISKKEEESSHSTESNVISNQPPEIEAEMSPEIRPAPGIPGEGNCLVDGQSYANNSAIPPANPCQLSCQCVSSIVQCEYEKCSPPPSDLINCTPVYSKQESCCPMYTCDSTPGAVLEVDNQMSDQHTTVAAESQTQSTEKMPIEESTQSLGTSTTKLQTENVDSTSAKSDIEEEVTTPVSPVERETESPSLVKDDVSTSEHPEISVKLNEDEEKEKPGQSTESVLATSTEERLKDVSDVDDTVVPHSTESEPEPQTEVSVEQPKESEENVSKATPGSEDSTTLIEIPSSTERSSLDEASQGEISTSPRTDAEDEKQSSSDKTIQEADITEKPAEANIPEAETTVSSEGSAESELTSLDSSEPPSSTTEDKSVEKEEEPVKPEEVNTTLTPESTEFVQPSTESSDKQAVSTSPESVETSDKVNIPEEHSTEKAVDSDVVTDSEPITVATSTEEDQTVAISMVTEAAAPNATSLIEDHESTSPNIVETSQSATEKSAPQTEATPVEDKMESSEETGIEKSTEKATIPKETIEESQTPSSENVDSSSTEGQADVKIKPVESSTEIEKETMKSNVDDITESPIDTKISGETEQPAVVSEEKEDATKEDGASTKEPSAEQDEIVPTSSQEPEKDQSSVSSEEPTATAESSTVGAYTDKTPELPTEDSEKELTSLDSSSEEISTEAGQKASSTDASSPDTSSSEKPEEEEQHEHEQTPSSTSEPQATASHDLQETSTKGQDDLTTSQGPTELYTTMHPLTRPKFPDQQVPETDDEHIFPPDGADIKGPFEDDSDTEDYDDQAVYGPGTCRYGGKIYMSAQQIPRDDPCDFCFCFRSDIICLQQSCPPPIPGCHEEPIGGFCCPRYECPVSMATSLNVTTTTTTTTTTLPPHFLSHAYKGYASRGGCQVGNRSYRIGEEIKSKSGPCMSCTCGGDGKMKCEPIACSASPMLKEMIAHAAARKRRR